MRGRVNSAVVLLALLVCSPAWADENPFIQSLQVRGSGRPVELETHAGQTLDRARIERDVRRLWATGWFDDVRVEATDTTEGIHLVFTLVEKPRLYLRRVTFEPKNGKRPLRLEPGAAIDPASAARVAAALRQQLIQEGYREAAVEAELIPAGFRQADLRLRVEPGQQHTVEAVRFDGNLGVSAEELRGALRGTRVRRLLPGIPGLWRGWPRRWRGWRLHPPYSESAIQADLERLRSFYLSQGYFEARVSLADVDWANNAATVTFNAEAGPRYRIRQVEMAGEQPAETPALRTDGSFGARELCRCLLAAQRESEKEGELEFAAQVNLEPARSRATPDEVDLRVQIETGPAYRVGRIEFFGHHHFSDLTLRRTLRLDEGDLFDSGRLRQSLARLNTLGLFEPLTEADVALARDADGGRVHLTIGLRERPRGRWALSGPLGPVSVAGPLEFRVGSRLPAWGSGPLELSTYTARVGLLAFSHPVLTALALTSQTRLLPVVTLERPYLAGQVWQSGFLLSPQLGWQAMLASYALAQARGAVHAALAPNPAMPPGLVIPVQWTSTAEDAVRLRAGQAEKTERQKAGRAGWLLCESPPPRLRWLRVAGATALDLLLAGQPL